VTDANDHDPTGGLDWRLAACYTHCMDHHPVIVISGSPAWAEALPPLPGFALVHYVDRAGYIARLVDDHAALIVVDGHQPDWRAWVTTPKASPATRRIPIALVAADPATRAQGPIAGADFVLAPAEIATRLPEIACQHARIMPAEVRQRLSGQCAEPLPPQARQAVDLFNAGQYYRQHDLFEALWVAEQGPVRDLYRAVLQVGVAYYQVTRGNRRGALKMLLRSLQWLHVLPDVCQGIDVARLRSDAQRLREALEAWPTDDLAGFDLALLGQVHLVER